MEINRCVKESFAVIGKEGSTEDGADFIQKLWEEANEKFQEIEQLAKRDEEGNILGIWGAMSDKNRLFHPWEDNFSRGLYLAGVEVKEGAQAPEGWTKWVIPAYEYIYVKSEGPETFAKVIQYMKDNGVELVGAAQDFNCPRENGQLYLFFPIHTL